MNKFHIYDILNRREKKILNLFINLGGGLAKKQQQILIQQQPQQLRATLTVPETLHIKENINNILTIYLLFTYSTYIAMKKIIFYVPKWKIIALDKLNLFKIYLSSMNKYAKKK